MQASKAYFQPATIQIRGSHEDNFESLQCSVQNATAERLSLIAQCRIQSGTEVVVHYEDVLFLGKVTACTQDIAHNWYIQVDVDDVVTGMQSLLNLRASLMGQSSVAPLPVQESLLR